METKVIFLKLLAFRNKMIKHISIPYQVLSLVYIIKITIQLILILISIVRL